MPCRESLMPYFPSVSNLGWLIELMRGQFFNVGAVENLIETEISHAIYAPHSFLRFRWST